MDIPLPWSHNNDQRRQLIRHCLVVFNSQSARSITRLIEFPNQSIGQSAAVVSNPYLGAFWQIQKRPVLTLKWLGVQDISEKGLFLVDGDVARAFAIGVCRSLCDFIH